MKKNLHKGGLLVLLLIILFALLSLLYTSIGNTKTKKIENNYPEQNNSETGIIAQLLNFKHAGKQLPLGKEYIAALYIEGTIQESNKTYNQNWLLSTIDSLTNDTKNSAIMLFINSPGGGVYEADEVYLALENYKIKTGRPIYAYMGPLAASGGYYIACAADNIIANRNTLTGSIGVIAGESVDVTGLLNKLGVKATTITAGKNKNMLNFNEPLSDEQKAIMQSVADEAYDQFTTIVSKSRNIKLDSIRKLADGRIYTAHQALNNGLIDRICSWDDAIIALEHDHLNGKDEPVRKFEYEEKTTFYDMLMGAITELKGASAISAPFNTLEKKAIDSVSVSVPYPAYYYNGR